MPLTLRIVLPFSVLFALLTGVSGWYAARQSAAVSEQRLVQRIRDAADQIAVLPLNRQEELDRIKPVVDLELAVGDVTGQVRHTLSATAGDAIRGLLPGKKGEGTVRIVGRSYRYVRGEVPGPFLTALVVLVPESRIHAVRAEATQGIFIGAGVATVLAVLLGIGLARSMTQPISALVRETVRIAQGDLDRRIQPSGPPELRILADSFNQMVESLARSRAELVEAEKRALLGRMATAVAHEIRNPLTPIRMTVQLLQERVDEEARRDLAVVLGEIDRLETVVGELLTLGRPGQPSLREVDLREPIGEILRLVEGRFAHRSVALDRDIESQPLTLQADPDRIKQAAMNLLLNALEASPADSRVMVRLSEANGWVTLVVEDQGGGVAEPDNLFTPFYTTKPEGTGIGLVLCRAIAEEHGGEVSYDPLPGGSRFALRLPTEKSVRTPAER